MGIVERYSRAASSSYLRLEREAGDLDVVVAAGYAKHLGTVLLRCRNEWDSQRAEFERMYAVLGLDRKSAEAEAKAEAGRQKEAKVPKAEADAIGRELRKKLDEEALLALETSRTLAIMGMRSLGRAFVLIQEIAFQRAARLRMELDSTDIAECVGNGLDIWLDQRCDGCAGRGFNGGFGVPVYACRTCKASGKARRSYPSKSRSRIALGEWVISYAEEASGKASRKIQEKLL